MKGKNCMKKLLTSVGAACLLATTAIAADEQNVEYYAHPTLFGTSAQENVSADNTYIVGGKILKTENRFGIKNKENVAVASFANDVLATIKTNTTDKIWNPKMPILRSELAVVLSEGLGLSKTTETTYTDVTAGYWAEAWINKALASNVMIGYPDNTFKPDQPVTKAEVFATLATLIDVATDKSLIIPEFKGYEMQYIPKWAIPATKEIVASKLLEDTPCPKKVANEEYLTKEQVAYLVGALRLNYIYNSENNATGITGAYAPTCISIKLNERLSAKVSNIGDKFSAKTTKDATLSGQTFAAGSTVKGEVVEVSRPGINNPGYIKVKFTEITDGENCIAFPKTLSEAQATALKNPNVIARLFGAPFSAAARVVGVAGRTVGSGVDVIGNGLEQYGDNLSNTFVNTLALQPMAGLKSFGNSFVTVGKGLFDIGKLAVSGVTGVVYEFADEVVYLVYPSASNNSSLNPGEELVIVY